jgi:hypothetical protein
MGRCMTEKEGMAWFKHNFADKVAAKLDGTPFAPDLIAAIAMQESFSDCWRLLFKTKPVDQVIIGCVGDSLDRAHTFPTDKADLVAFDPHGKTGQQAFDIARAALIMLAGFNDGYKPAAKNPNKFCHGFGIFQYDIQFFKDGNPTFFLQKKWHDFDECLSLCVDELNKVAKRLFPGKAELDDEQMTYVAIGYNIGAGRVRVGAGFKQGHKDDGVFYGENINRFLQLAHAVPATP